MRFDLITIFPEFFAGPLDHGIVRRAKEAGIAQIHVQDLREFAKDRHRTVDDRPFGGGEGMVLKPEPLFEAVEKLLGHEVGDAGNKASPEPGTAILLMSAAGRLFTQETARRYAKLEQLILICGRYEGVDERVAEHLATEEICVGDYVLSGGDCFRGRWGMRRPRRMSRLASTMARGETTRANLERCWTSRTTRDRRNTAAGRCPRC